MYLQITNRCNMSCAHCGMNCTAKGEDMTPRMYKKAIEYIASISESITIGGGEPTLHKHFWEIMGLSLGSVENVWLATNGSITDTALKLANMARRGVIGCALSQDYYHDPIDERVVQAFQKDRKSLGNGISVYANNDRDLREIRDVSDNIVNAGRCNFGEDGCVCSEIIITPDGTIMGCGCDDAPSFGNVFKPAIPDDWE